MAVETIGDMAATAIIGVKIRIKLAECLLDKLLFRHTRGHGLIEYLIIALMATGTTLRPYRQGRRPRVQRDLGAMAIGAAEFGMNPLKLYRLGCRNRNGGVTPQQQENA
jgi:hypothetical protein